MSVFLFGFIGLSSYIASVCNVLYCTVLHCTVLNCAVLHCTVLCCTALYSPVLNCTLLHYTSLCYANKLHWSILFHPTNKLNSPLSNPHTIRIRNILKAEKKTGCVMIVLPTHTSASFVEKKELIFWRSRSATEKFVANITTLLV